MITPEMIPVIENSFGFQLYDWQRDYLLGKTNYRAVGRRNGNTFAYCVKLLLSDGEPIKRKNIVRYVDEYHGNRYLRWFAGYCMDINKVLKESGLKTRLMD